jgi:hypothetical protein
VLKATATARRPANSGVGNGRNRRILAGVMRSTKVHLPKLERALSPGDEAFPCAPFASFADRSTSVSDKEYFQYERSAAARSHAAGTPGHAPEGVLDVACLDNPRDNTRGKVL